MFVVQLAAEIFGVKTNFELSFPSRPTVSVLTQTGETAFSNEIALRRPENVPKHSFHVAKLKVYDDERNKWVDLLSEAQLSQYCQIYAFQPENLWHKESPKELPPATKPPTSAARYGGGEAVNISSAFIPPDNANNRSSVGTASNKPAVQVASALPSRAYNSNPSEEEKYRIIFAEFDLKGNRMIDLEDLKNGFRALGLEFTTATISDLFQKGDANHDGRITFSEFERFARLYPIMTDCLFYRSKAFWDEEQMNRELQGEKNAVLQSQSVVKEAVQAVAQAQKSVEESTEMILRAESDLKDRQGRLRDLQKDVDQVNRDKERVQKEKYDKENDLLALRDKERQSRQMQQELARELEKQERRSAGLVQEAVKAEDKVKQLEAALLEAKRFLERAQNAVKQAQGETDATKVREKDSVRQLETIGRETVKADEALRMADNNLLSVNERLRELDVLSRDLMRDAEEANRRRDSGERTAQATKEHLTQMQAELERAKQGAEERERQAKAREQELLEQQRQRQLVSQHERTLIEQELRLREQRESLDEKETRLKTEANSFLSNLRQQIGSRSYSRDPSVLSDAYQRGYSGY